MKLTNTLAGILATTFLGTLALLIWAEINQIDTSEIYLFISAAVGAAFPGIINGKRLNQVKEQNDGIKEQTNGTLTKLTQQITHLTAENATLKAQAEGQDNG